MYIKEIELNNFRIYKGVNRISLTPKDEKNIVIVSGQNGFGKTTFLMSLVWCLYGRNMEQVDAMYKKEIDDKGNYTKYITDSMNRKAVEEGETEFSVTISFAGVNVQNVLCDVVVKRSYNIITGTSDKIEVLISGQPQELIENLSQDNQKGEEIFIRDFILPIAIAKFFFFDAEKITSLAEINQKDQRRQLWLLVNRCKAIIEKRFNPDGFNIGINVGEDAGQSIFHIHIHLIPRYKGDVENPRGGVRGVIPNKQNY